MRRLPALLILGVLAVIGCGDDEGLDYSLRTPPPYIGAEPVAPPGQRLVERMMTEADADRLRPVIADWASAVRAGDIARASGFFTLPSIVRQSGHGALSVNAPRVAEAFNASLPCGAKLLATEPQGRYVVGTFVLVGVGTLPCERKGGVSRVGFVFGDKDHPRRFSEWWQLPREPGARVGPAERPATVAPATVGDFG